MDNILYDLHQKIMRREDIIQNAKHLIWEQLNRDVNMDKDAAEFYEVLITKTHDEQKALLYQLPDIELLEVFEEMYKQSPYITAPPEGLFAFMEILHNRELWDKAIAILKKLDDKL